MKKGPSVYEQDQKAATILYSVKLAMLLPKYMVRYIDLVPN